MGALIEVNTDGLAKLADTISYCTGLKARGRRKMADAEAYAAIKQAETETQIELLKMKGRDDVADYIEARESRRLDNVKSVIENARSHFRDGEKVSDKAVNPDWTARFLNIVEDISDETLRELWSRILAGEVKQPNSFSLRTMDLLRNITKEEAELFIKAAKFNLANNFVITEKFALDLHENLLLMEAGFINSEDLIKKWVVEPHDKLEVIIDEKCLLVLHNNTDKQICCRTSVKKLTKAGIEILPLVEKSDRSGFYKDLANLLKSKGVSRVFRHEIVESGDNCLYRRVGEEL